MTLSSSALLPQRARRQLHVGPVILTHPMHLLRRPAPERCLASSPTRPAPVSSSTQLSSKIGRPGCKRSLSLCVHLQLQPLVPPHPVTPFFERRPSTSCRFVLHQSKNIAIRPFASWASNVSSSMEDVSCLVNLPSYHLIWVERSENKLSWIDAFHGRNVVPCGHRAALRVCGSFPVSAPQPREWPLSSG